MKIDVRDVGLISESGRSPGGGHGNPLQYSCLENPMDRGAWQVTVHGVADLFRVAYVFPERSSGFPYFLQFKSEFGNEEFMI